MLRQIYIISPTHNHLFCNCSKELSWIFRTNFFYHLLCWPISSQYIPPIYFKIYFLKSENFWWDTCLLYWVKQNYPSTFFNWRIQPHEIGQTFFESAIMITLSVSKQMIGNTKSNTCTFNWSYIHHSQIHLSFFENSYLRREQLSYFRKQLGDKMKTIKWSLDIFMIP